MRPIADCFSYQKRAFLPMLRHHGQLFQAARKGDVNKVVELLDSGLDIEFLEQVSQCAHMISCNELVFELIC